MLMKRASCPACKEGALRSLDCFLRTRASICFIFLFNMVIFYLTTYIEFPIQQAGVWGLGFGVWGLRFGVWGLVFGVWGSGFGIQGLGCEVWGFTWPALAARRNRMLCRSSCMILAISNSFVFEVLVSAFENCKDTLCKVLMIHLAVLLCALHYIQRSSCVPHNTFGDPLAFLTLQLAILLHSIHYI